MDLAKSFSSLRDQLLGLTGISEKDVSKAGESIELSLGNIGMDQSTFAIGLLCVAGLLFISLLMMISRRKSVDIQNMDSSHLEDRVGELEQALHDLKSQMAAVKGQVKADMGYLKQEVSDVRLVVSHLMPSHEERYVEPEDRSMAVND